MRIAIVFLLCCLLLTLLRAQNLQPSVFGDNMLCPGSTGTVSTQTYDTYQWNRRYFGSSNTQPLAGQVFQQLVMDYYSFSASYVSVTVTQGWQTATSPEFFVDGYVFLPVFVMTGGTFTIGPQGEFVICPGDTLVFELGMPYNTRITWFRNGLPITGATSPVLEVVTDGTYGVSGAPAVCPDYIQSLGVPLEVSFCTVNFEEHLQAQPKLVPLDNASRLKLVGADNIDNPSYRIFDSLGRLIRSGRMSGNSLSADGLPVGLYFIHIDQLPAFRWIKQVWP